jgi:hypothetical protein
MKMTFLPVIIDLLTSEVMGSMEAWLPTLFFTGKRALGL